MQTSQYIRVKMQRPIVLDQIDLFGLRILGPQLDIEGRQALTTNPAVLAIRHLPSEGVEGSHNAEAGIRAHTPVSQGLLATFGATVSFFRFRVKLLVSSSDF